MPERDTYKYHFIKDRTVVHRGITNDLERREQEHQNTYGKVSTSASPSRIAMVCSK